MSLCAVSLGGNVGDVPGAFAAAIRQLTSLPGISQVEMSRSYCTAPMGAVAGDVFQNAACVFETTLLPLEVLDRLQQIETDCGRIRTVRWGPRTLDLDLLLYADQIIESPPRASKRPSRLTVPHPAMWYRRFVLDPLSELIPDELHPVFHQTMRELRARLLPRPLPIGWDVSPIFAEIRKMVSTAHPTVDRGKDDRATAIVFTTTETSLANGICLPTDVAAAGQLIHDVLTAALDEPVPYN